MILLVLAIYCFVLVAEGNYDNTHLLALFPHSACSGPRERSLLTDFSVILVDTELRTRRIMEGEYDII